MKEGGVSRRKGGGERGGSGEEREVSKCRSASVITGGRLGNSSTCQRMEGAKLVSAESILPRQLR